MSLLTVQKELWLDFSCSSTTLQWKGSKSIAKSLCKMWVQIETFEEAKLLRWQTGYAWHPKPATHWVPFLPSNSDRVLLVLSCDGFDHNGLACHLFSFAVEAIAIVYRGTVASLNLLVMLWLVQHSRGAKTIFVLPISCCICTFQLPVPTCLPLTFDHWMSTVFLAKYLLGTLET